MHPITPSYLFTSEFSLLQVNLDEVIRFAEVQYFTQLPIKDSEPNTEWDQDNNWQFMNTALVKLYLTPDPVLLQQSSQTVASSTLLPDFVILPIHSILSLIAMVPYEPTLASTVQQAYSMPPPVNKECFLGANSTYTHHYSDGPSKYISCMSSQPPTKFSPCCTPSTNRDSLLKHSKFWKSDNGSILAHADVDMQ